MRRWTALAAGRGDSTAGSPAFGNAVAIHRFGEDEQRFANGKAFDQVLEPGDAYILRSGGGGGYGSPLDREPETVERDVRQGYVTKAAAEKLYGVVFHDGTLDVDLVRTQKRREEMRAQALPVNDPETPDAPGEGWSLNLNRRRPQGTRTLSDEERLVIAMTGRCC